MGFPTRVKNTSSLEERPAQVYTKPSLSQSQNHQEKVSIYIRGIFSRRKIWPLTRLYGYPGARTGGASWLKYLWLLKSWLPDLVRQFPHGTTVCFMLDGADIYCGTLVKNWLSQIEARGISRQMVKLVKWPPYSPDMNPIETVWVQVKSLFERLDSDRSNSKYTGWALRIEIQDTVEHCWELLDSEYFENLAKSMPETIKEVIEAKGWYTRF